MPEFIFMPTCDDCTVADARAVYDEARDTGLRYVGFKDLGLPVERLKDLASAIRSGGQQVVLEIVSERKEEELRSARAAINLGVDYLLGGTHAREVARMLVGTGIPTIRFRGVSAAIRAGCAATSRILSPARGS